MKILPIIKKKILPNILYLKGHAYVGGKMFYEH